MCLVCGHVHGYWPAGKVTLQVHPALALPFLAPRIYVRAGIGGCGSNAAGYFQPRYIPLWRNVNRPLRILLTTPLKQATKLARKTRSCKLVGTKTRARVVLVYHSRQRSCIEKEKEGGGAVRCLEHLPKRQNYRFSHVCNWPLMLCETGVRRPRGDKHTRLEKAWQPTL